MTPWAERSHRRDRASTHADRRPALPVARSDRVKSKGLSMAAVDELYARTIKPLPETERIRLAALILNDIAAGSPADEREDWSDEDLRDFRLSSMALVDAATDDAGA